MSLAVPAPDFCGNPEVVGGTANIKQLPRLNHCKMAQNLKCKHHFDCLTAASWFQVAKLLWQEMTTSHEIVWLVCCGSGLYAEEWH